MLGVVMQGKGEFSHSLRVPVSFNYAGNNW